MTTYKVLSTSYISWCGLGFMRGMHDYKYNVKNEYLYLSSVTYGCLGVIIYGNPVAFPYTLYKEIYRLEVNLRNIENEKKNSFYNDLL